MKHSLSIIVLCICIQTSAQEEPTGISFSAGVNAWWGSENADDSGTPAEGLVSDASYNFQFNYKFPTKKESSWIPFVKSVQQYVSLRAVKFRSQAMGEGYEWIEQLQALGVVYGQRYFLRDDFQGFNVGWYLGVATAKTDGIEWNPSFPEITASPYTEQFILPLNALELNYHFEYKILYIEPTYTLYVNSSSFNFDSFPSIIVGFNFNQK